MNINFIQKIAKFKVPFLNPFTLCLDLGSSFTRLAIKDKGIVCSQPSYLGYYLRNNEYIFFGEEAKKIIGKTPEFLKIIKPVTNGVIADFDATTALVSYLIKEYTSPYLNKHFIRPPMRAVTAIARNATEIERKALEEVMLKVGFTQIFIVEKPIAIAAFIRSNIFSHHPILVVDLGGGLIDASVISGGGVIANRIIKSGGDHFLQQIIHYLYLKYGIIIGLNTSEALLVNLLNFNQEEKQMVIRGKSLESGLPKSIKVRSSDIKEALTPVFINILDMLRELIEMISPEVVDEIFKKGIFLSGGLANIPNLSQYFSKELKIQVSVFERPENALINGLLRLANDEDWLRKLSINLT
jgi:rod shape-determining protein MreB